MKVMVAVVALLCGTWYLIGDNFVFHDRLGWIKNDLGIGSSSAAISGSTFVTVPVELGELHREISATGTLNPTVNVEVGSQLSGQIARVFADFNDRVAKDQPIAQLDQRTYQARVAEAEAALQMAKVAVTVAGARLDRAKIDASDAEAQARVLGARRDNAQVRLDAAQSELRRKQALRERQIGSAVDLEDAQTKASAAEASLREADAIAAAQQDSIAGTKVDLRRVQSELDAAIASVPEKQALLHEAQIDLERTTIRSPIAGIVVGRKVNEGQTLATSLEAKTLFIIAGDLQQMEIHAMVDEADIGKIRAGLDATFTVDAYPGRQFTATVRQVRKAPEVKQNVVTYTVVLAAENHENLLLPGMTALVRITVSRTGPVLKLPLAALRFVPRGAGRQAEQPGPASDKLAPVWVSAENGEPKRIVVRLGADDSSHAAVLSGPLHQGDRVIVGEIGEASPNRVFGIRIGF